MAARAAIETEMPRGARRVLMVQFAGDYREAALRLGAGGEETYAAQRYSVESVAQIAGLVQELAVLVCITDRAYDERLENGVRAIGAGFQDKIPAGKLVSMIDAHRPTDLILCTPVREVLHWAVRRRVRTLALFADSFRAGNVRARYRNRRLANALNHAVIEWVANHNVNACRSLEGIGVNRDKIVPWDWAPSVTPEQYQAKFLYSEQETFILFYAGSLSEDKGVGDLLRAVSELKRRGVSVSVQLAGPGETARFKVLAVKLGIADRTFFLGVLPNNAVVELMREADAVVVPSRHRSPEGLPMTIYEAFSSRTPILASDHPMFRGKLTDGLNALTFRAGDADDLAAKAQLLFSDSELYGRLSEESRESWRRLQIPVKFRELIERWVRDSEEDRGWIRSYALVSGIYEQV